MTPTEECYLKLRNKLDELGYFQPLSFDSVLLVDKIVEDLLDTKRNLQHYKNVAQQSMEVNNQIMLYILTADDKIKHCNTINICHASEEAMDLLKA